MPRFPKHQHWVQAPAPSSADPTLAQFRLLSFECRDLTSESINNTSLANRTLYGVPGLDTETLACPSKKASCGIFDSIQFRVLNRNLQPDISVSFSPCLTVGPFTGRDFWGWGMWVGVGCRSGAEITLNGDKDSSQSVRCAFQ